MDSQLEMYASLLYAIDMQAVLVGLTRWPGGLTISHDGARKARMAADWLVEFWRPLGHVVAGREFVAGEGQFAGPGREGEYILLASAGAVFGDMSNDLDLVAVDLRSLDVRVSPRFMDCRRLCFVRFPTGITTIPERAFRGCIQLVAVDFTACRSLLSIGDYAFGACFALERLVLPSSMQRLGEWAFSGSGLKSVAASGCRLRVGKGAFASCTALREVDLGPTELGVAVFAGCHALRDVTIQRVDACHPLSMLGSSVTSVNGSLSEEAMTELFGVLGQPGPVYLRVEWAGGRQESIVPMTTLIVRNGPCQIKEALRRNLHEIDLTPLEELPRRLTLQRSFFLVRALLPRRLLRIPARMFQSCQRLEHTNIGECSALREIGDLAFLHCWMLHEMEIPAQCEVLRVGNSGVRRLDLRSGRPSVVEARNCADLRMLILPRVFRGKLDIGWAASLTSLTVGNGPGDSGWAMDMLPREVRYVGARFTVLEPLEAMMPLARVLSELAGVTGRPGCPLPPV